MKTLLLAITLLAINAQAQDLGLIAKAEVVKITPTADNINLQVKVTHTNGSSKTWDHWLNDEQAEFAADPAAVINRAYVTAFKMLFAEIKLVDDAKKPALKSPDITAPTASDLRIYVDDVKQQIATKEAEIAAMPDTVQSPVVISRATGADYDIGDGADKLTDKEAAQKELEALKKKLP